MSSVLGYAESIAYFKAAGKKHGTQGSITLKARHGAGGWPGKDVGLCHITMLQWVVWTRLSPG